MSRAIFKCIGARRWKTPIKGERINKLHTGSSTLPIVDTKVRCEMATSPIQNGAPKYWRVGIGIEIQAQALRAPRDIRGAYSVSVVPFTAFAKINQVVDCLAKTTAALVADTPVSDDPPANPEAACSYSSC
ncbi:hypothetical protein DVH24_037634 [Malus domestica]|uniref:Uncharacterized protein n=1 Tax=Malus domestica TaxID=3750 RepID=A0A498IX40_MALDO|nr:hypothetical protein DVH24_037634 [Malus domestica]